MSGYIVKGKREVKTVQDEMIVELFWKRDEAALSETENKYRGYLSKIALNILSDLEDAREIVNETLFRAWNSIPPQRPDILKTYLGKLARQLSIDVYRREHRKKRISSELTVSLEELGDIIFETEQSCDLSLLGEAVDAYLKTVSKSARTAFVQRYYFADALKDIAKRQGVSESAVKSMLFRTRRGLKEYLEKEGFEI